MKILIVKPHLPLPAHQGTRRVTMGLIRDLSEKHQVHYLCMLEDVDEIPRVAELESMGIRVRAPLMPNRQSLIHRMAYRAVNDLSALVTGYPRDYFYATPPVFASALSEWTRETKFDLVILEYWKMARLRPHVRSGLPVVLAHDAEFVKRARQSDALDSTPASRFTSWRLKRESAREVQTLHECQSILALTEQDREDLLMALGPDYKGQIRVLPVAANTALRSSEELATEPVVGFLGSFKGDFNVDAVEYLLDEVWPLVLQKRPDARLHIAGGHAPAEWRKYAGKKGVTFLGFVDELDRFLGSVRALVVPLRFGGGLRIRILDALTAGTAVVSTSVGVSGLDVKSGREVLIADGAEKLAEALCLVLDDADLQKRLVTEGQAFARERYSPEVVGKQTRELVAELMRARTAA